jgi:SAM-dependent methyltransferase
VSGGNPLEPGSSFRTSLRTRFPHLRAVVLAPRRWWHDRHWRRLHQELSGPDRALLEGQVLPALAASATADAPVLFIGVDWYTADYPARFEPGALVTVDIDPAHAQWGAPEHHTLDARELADAFPPSRFAVVVANGVFGHGLDGVDGIARALAGCHSVLTDGGVLLVGWNDHDAFRPPPLEPLARAAGFVPEPALGFREWRTAVEGPLHHVYDVYRRVTPATPTA